ncbi:MAG: cupin domain-containing protein [Candidatus Moranbacteria bacterium]|nr:cupin domain-containing protein [Candidatus Moranbacteria bacterium]
MIIKSRGTNQKIVGPMIINEYKINSDFSAALIEINGDHGKLKCIGEDRIYFILEGEGKFVIGDEESKVNPNDLIFVPKNTPYNIIGKMKYFLICSPEFNPRDDVFL